MLKISDPGESSSSPNSRYEGFVVDLIQVKTEVNQSPAIRFVAIR